MWSGSFSSDLYSHYMYGDEAEYFKKGDFIDYDSDNNESVDHISLIYTDPVCDESGNCTYKIVHAYGVRCTEYEEDGSCAEGKFSRKVLVTSNTIKSPVGFGRIKLWD